MRLLLTAALAAGLGVEASAQYVNLPTPIETGVPMSGFGGYALPGARLGGPVLMPVMAPLAKLNFDLSKIPTLSLQPGVTLRYPTRLDVATLGAPTQAVMLAEAPGIGRLSSVLSSPALRDDTSTRFATAVVKLLDHRILSGEERSMAGIAMAAAAQIALDSKPSREAWTKYDQAQARYKETLAGVLAGREDSETLRKAATAQDSAKKAFQNAAERREAGLGFIVSLAILSLHDQETRHLAENRLNVLRNTLGDMGVTGRGAFDAYERAPQNQTPVTDRAALAATVLEKFALLSGQKPN